jgi:hypothetical protein
MKLLTIFFLSFCLQLGTVLRMKPFHVLHKIPLLAECPLAHLTTIGPLPRVNSHVSGEMAALPEALATNLAAVGSDARVSAQMASQAAALAEIFQAKVTLVALSGRREQRIAAAACRSAQESPTVFEELQAAGQGLVLQPELRIRIGSGFNRVSGSGFGIRIQEDKNDPQK